MKQTLSMTLTAIIYLATSLGQSIAADDPMELTMSVEEEIEVVDAKGNRQLKRVPAENVIPGDTVVYTTQYHYRGEQPADNVVITNIIPNEVTYLSGSATGSQQITFSVDGGQHFDQEHNLTITTEGGKQRPATARDYTHVRWVLPRLSHGQSGSVSFLSRINEE